MEPEGGHPGGVELGVGLEPSCLTRGRTRMGKTQDMDPGLGHWALVRSERRSGWLKHRNL